VHWGISQKTQDAGHKMNFLLDCPIVSFEAINGPITDTEMKRKEY
jgi:hypothetical protein